MVHCAPATEIRVVVTAHEGACTSATVTTIRTASALDVANRVEAPVKTTANGCDGSSNVGTAVLSPSGDGDRVAIVVRGNATPNDANNEIIARRELTYVTGSSVTVRVDLRPPCARNPCPSPDETCVAVDGQARCHVAHID